MGAVVEKTDVAVFNEGMAARHGRAFAAAIHEHTGVKCRPLEILIKAPAASAIAHVVAALAARAEELEYIERQAAGAMVQPAQNTFVVSVHSPGPSATAMLTQWQLITFSGEPV